MGIEPTLFAWEAKVLPLNYTRFCVTHDQIIEVGAMRAAQKKHRQVFLLPSLAVIAKLIIVGLRLHAFTAAPQSGTP